MRKICSLLSFCSISLLSSCSLINNNTIYDANALNIPLHKEKKELKGSAGYGSILGFNTDVSYAATNNISVKAAANYNHQYLIKNRLLGGDHFNLKNHLVEGAAGYYKYLDKRFINSFELSAGYGNGLTNKSVDDRFEGSYHKLYLQMNAGHVSNKAEFGLGIRYSSIIYPDLYYRFREEKSHEFHHFNYSNIHSPTLEWALMGAVGSKKIKATLQSGLAIPLKEITVPVNDLGYQYQYLNNWSAIFQIGIRYNFLLAKQEIR